MQPLACEVRHDGRVIADSIEVSAALRLTCHVAGDADAPPMVLLHGLGASGADWEVVAAAFARDYRLIAPDLRGHGASDWPGVYSYELMRDDVSALLDALGLDDVVLVGHSMAAVVAWLLAIAQPQRVHRLIVEDAPLPFPRETPVRERPDMPLPFDWDVIVAIAAQTNDPERRWWKYLPGLTTPTLVVGGGPTSTIPQDVLAEAAALVPHCTMVTIAAGHHVHSTEPQAFSDTVLGWLRRT